LGAAGASGGSIKVQTVAHGGSGLADSSSSWVISSVTSNTGEWEFFGGDAAVCNVLLNTIGNTIAVGL
jgi:hypothetical protein